MGKRVYLSNDKSFLQGVKEGIEEVNDSYFSNVSEVLLCPEDDTYEYMLDVTDEDSDEEFNQFYDEQNNKFATECVTKEE